MRERTYHCIGIRSARLGCRNYNRWICWGNETWAPIVQSSVVVPIQKIIRHNRVSLQNSCYFQIRRSGNTWQSGIFFNRTQSCCACKRCPELWSIILYQASKGWATDRVLVGVNIVNCITVETDVVVPPIAWITDTSVTNGLKSAEQNAVGSKLIPVGLFILLGLLHYWKSSLRVLHAAGYSWMFTCIASYLDLDLFMILFYFEQPKSRAYLVQLPMDLGHTTNIQKLFLPSSKFYSRSEEHQW